MKHSLASNCYDFPSGLIICFDPYQTSVVHICRHSIGAQSLLRPTWADQPSQLPVQ